MFDFSQKKQQTGLEPWAELESIGAKIVSGKPKQSGRIDYGSLTQPIIVGVWECTQGKFEISYPWNELATIQEGSVTITDSTGKAMTFRAGDTHFAVKGERVTWDIQEAKVRKCFFIYTGDQVAAKAAAE